MQHYYIKSLRKTITQDGNDLFIDATNINDLERSYFKGIKKSEVLEILKIFKYDLDGDPDMEFCKEYPFISHIYFPIVSTGGACALLDELYRNNELYNPMQDAHEINFPESCPTPEQCDELNNRMQEMRQIGFDPSEYILELSRRIRAH